MEGEEEVIMAGAAYDVPADNYEEFDDKIEPAKLGDKLVQSNTLKGTVRKYRFYAPRHLLLHFVEKKNAKAKYFRVDLAWLSSKPDHIKVIVWKWLYGALAAGILTLLCLYLAIVQIVAREYCAVAGAITLTATLICALIFMYLMRDEFVFKSRFGEAKLFLIENKRPTQAVFDNFFIRLQQAIDKAHANISVADGLVGELKMSRRLRDEGIIDDKTYTNARTAIFRHEQYKT